MVSETDTIDDLIDLRRSARRQLIYIPETGDFFWRNSGKVAGHRTADGYITIRLNGVLRLAHRLAYLLYHRELPALVDHIDRNPSNNAISNLRAADKRVNSINRDKPSNNTSGVKGVSWHKGGGMWTAQIKNNGVKIHLGAYSKLSDAVEARLKAEEELWGDI